MDIDLDQLRELMRTMEEFGASELELENAEERILVRRGAAAPHAQGLDGRAAGSGVPATQPPPPFTGAVAAGSVQDGVEEGILYITSPFVGTFYRASGPDAEPFATEGQHISPGQVLCIVEAMKLMNEIEAEVSGTIVEILGVNGKPVEYGDRLFKVRTS